MNVLQTALGGVQTLIPNEQVDILKEINFKNESGFAVREVARLQVSAQIQPAQEQELKELANGILGSDSCYKFYLLGNQIEILNFIKNEQCFICWGNDVFKIIRKMDYSGNGWIKVVGVYFCNYLDFEKGEMNV